MNGQLIWKADLPDSKASRFWSSFELAKDGSAAGEWASLAMILAASSACGPRVTLVPLTIEPPADCTSALNHTVAPSYCAPWISRYGACFNFEAASISWLQVVGGFLTRSLRYHSNC